MRQDYLPRFAVGDYVAIDLAEQVLVVRIVDIRPRFNEVYGIPTYYVEPPMAKGHNEIMAPMLDSSFRRATKQEVLIFYKGEYDHGQGD